MDIQSTIPLSERGRQSVVIRGRHMAPGTAVAIALVTIMVFRLVTIGLASFFSLTRGDSLYRTEDLMMVMFVCVVIYGVLRQRQPMVNAILSTVLAAIPITIATLFLDAFLSISGRAGTFPVLSYLVSIVIGVIVYRWAAVSDIQTSLTLQTLTNMLRNRSARIGIVIILSLVLIGDFAPFIATHSPIQSMIGLPGETGRLPSKPPCIPAFGCTEPLHILGLDLNGRDLFSRVVYGAATSLRVGVASVGFAIFIGTVLGLISGYAGGWIDNVIMRMMDVLLAFPSLLLAIAIVTVLGPGLENALLAIAIVSIPVYARLSRASVLSVKELEYITAAQALGTKPDRILFGQIFPNTLTPLIVQGTLGIGSAVLEAAALSFLGLGAQPPLPEWGQMLSEGRAYVFTAPHLVFFPGFAIMLTVLGFNLLGDGIRDALDPRTRGKS